MPSASRSRPRSLADQLLTEAGEGEITAAEQAAAAEASFRAVPRALLIPIERITPSKDNPRKAFAHLDDLADSIAERGVLHALVVRRDPERSGYYVTVAGARRLLAARIVQGRAESEARARVAALPCVVADQTDRDAFADALAENLARQDLSRAEVMVALLRLQQEYEWSARYIARRIGRSVSDVAELLGIAKDADVAGLVRDEIITPTTAGQIRRLPKELRPTAVEGVLSGRVKTVGDVRRLRQQPSPTGAAPSTPPAGAPRHSTAAGVSDIGHPSSGSGIVTWSDGPASSSLVPPGDPAGPEAVAGAQVVSGAAQDTGPAGEPAGSRPPASRDLAAAALAVARAIGALPHNPGGANAETVAILRQARDDLAAYLARAEAALGAD